MIWSSLQNKFLVRSRGSQKYESAAQKRNEILNKKLSVSRMEVEYDTLRKIL